MLIQSYKVKKEQADAQKQADAINEDPVDWFNTHFDGGVQHPTETHASETSDKSGESK